MELSSIIDLQRHPLMDRAFQDACRQTLDQRGVLVLGGFLSPTAVRAIYENAIAKRPHAYFCEQRHNVYLLDPDPAFAEDHPRNRQVTSSKGCICDDVIDPDSPLRALYGAAGFKDFLCAVLGEAALYDYADPLSSINLHYADPGQELGWHFDNSSFATTLMIDAPEQGGAFEYVGGLRDADSGDMNFAGVGRVLDGGATVETLDIQAGDLVLFRGRNALHRVTPVGGSKTRLLVVFAYNSSPGIALSESARLTFFGRLE
ncbi:MAG: 2OG-Fe(II) oxygenase [Rhodospirillales bacterium]|nr:2OG-Fe(II) oxygenase [Rhodospirillales bacterium]